MNQRGMHTGNGRDWPLERIEQLAALAAKGLSARVIADKMHMSRNAILGMCYRRKIVIQPQPKKRRIRAGMGNVRITLNTPRRPYAGPTLDFHAEATLQPMAPIAAPTATPVDIMGLEPHHCRYPLGEPSANMLYCGATIAGDRLSFCPFHYQMACRPRVA